MNNVISETDLSTMNLIDTYLFRIVVWGNSCFGFWLLTCYWGVHYKCLLYFWLFQLSFGQCFLFSDLKCIFLFQGACGAPAQTQHKGFPHFRGVSLYCGTRGHSAEYSSASRLRQPTQVLLQWWVVACVIHVFSFNLRCLSCMCLLHCRGVCRFRWNAAYSWEWRQRKSNQHAEGAVRLQDGGDDRRRSHGPGGLSSGCE